MVGVTSLLQAAVVVPCRCDHPSPIRGLLADDDCTFTRAGWKTHGGICSRERKCNRLRCALRCATDPCLVHHRSYISKQFEGVDTLHYGQKFMLKATATDETGEEYYLKSRPVSTTAFSRFSKHQEVCCTVHHPPC